LGPRAAEEALAALPSGAPLVGFEATVGLVNR
jgi:hypothetical protein